MIPGQLHGDNLVYGRLEFCPHFGKVFFVESFFDGIPEVVCV